MKLETCCIDSIGKARLKRPEIGNSPSRGLRLCALTAEGLGSIPHVETKIPRVQQKSPGIQSTCRKA